MLLVKVIPRYFGSVFVDNLLVAALCVGVLCFVPVLLRSTKCLFLFSKHLD